jgi:hypothetical protein
MRISNSMDGMYFFMLVIPFVLSIWAGDLFRRKIESFLVVENYLSHNLSAIAGILAEILIIITGAGFGLLLVKLV